MVMPERERLSTVTSGGLNHRAPSSEGYENYFSVARVKRSLLHYLAGRGVTSVANFAVAIIVVRELSIADYAAYTAVYGIMMLSMVVTNGGLERIVPRYLPQLCQSNALRQLQRYCWALLAVRVLLLLPLLGAVGVAWAPLSRWFGIPTADPMLHVLLAYFLLFALSQHVTRTLQALLLQKQATQGMALEWLSKLLLILILVVYSEGLTLVDAIIVQSLSLMISIVFMVWVLNSHIARLVRESGDRNATQDASITLSKVVSLGWFNYLHGLTAIHTGPAITKMISAALFSEAVTAAFGFAHAISGMLKRYLPANLLLGLVEPVLMARHEAHGQLQQTVGLVSMLLKFNLFLLVPATLWFLVFGEPLVLIITDGRYADSVWMVCSLIALLGLESHRLMLQLIANALEESQWLFHSNLVSMSIIPVAVLLVLQMGILGLVVAMFLVSFVRNAYVINRLNSSGYSYRPDYFAFGKLLAMAAIAVGMAWALLLPVQSSLAASLFSIGIVPIAYFLFAYLWKVFTEEEREAINGFLGRRLLVW